MRFIVSPRGAGKTKALVAWAMRSSERVIIVFNEREKKRILESTELLPFQVCTAHDAVYGRLAGRQMDIAIDNLDLILPFLLGVQDPIQWATITEEEEPNEPAPDWLEEIPNSTEDGR